MLVVVAAITDARTYATLIGTVELANVIWALLADR